MEMTDIITLAGVAGIIGILLNLQYRLHRDLSSLRQDMNRDLSSLRQDMNRDLSSLRQHMNKETGGLRERLARIEGLFEGFVKREIAPPGGVVAR